MITMSSILKWKNTLPPKKEIALIRQKLPQIISTTLIIVIISTSTPKAIWKKFKNY
jgi:hypothetical protein